jgi:hypothetical protein
MTTTIEDIALMELRVKLYGAAQLLKGDALEELKTVVREIAMVLDIDRPRTLEEMSAAAVPTRGDTPL